MLYLFILCVGGWIESLSRGGLTVPSQSLIVMVNSAEKIFNSYHGSGLNKEPGVIQAFFTQLTTKFPNISKKVLKKLARTRTFIRLRYLNRKAHAESILKREKRKRKQFCVQPQS